MAALLLDPASQYALSLPVTSFCKDVQASPVFSSYIMLQATHFKARDVLGHEFLLLRVSSGTHNFTLRVERRPSAPNYGDKTLPDDRISREPDILDEDVFRERFHVLGHLAGFAIDGPAPGIPLSSVCDILTMMDVEPAWYSLISQQSYWYCSMFLHHVLQRTPGVRVVRVPGPWHTWRRRSKFLKRWVVFTSEDIERDIEGWLREAKLREAERSDSPDTLVDAEAWQTDPVFRSYFTEFRRSSSDTDNTEVDGGESFRLQANDAEPLKLQVINDEPLPEKQEVPKATSTENTNTFCDPSILQWVH